MTLPRPKPKHLAAEFAAQFGDDEVATAYRHRPPYPPEAFAIVEPLLGPHPRCVLELGAGTGDFTIGLAPRVEWLAMAAEDYTFDRQYSAVVAAEAFHWLDWYRVLPRLAESLAPSGHLILVERTLAEPLPWEPDLRGLIREYSTNRDYVAYDTVAELEARGLIDVGGRAQTQTVAYRQPVDSYVESLHSRNGFSRARLQASRAQEFDDKLKALVCRYCPDETVRLPVQARIVWGSPQ